MPVTMGGMRTDRRAYSAGLLVGAPAGSGLHGLQPSSGHRSIPDGGNDRGEDHERRQHQERRCCGARSPLCGPQGDGAQRQRQGGYSQQEYDYQHPAHRTMIRSALFTGRILAALGAVLAFATLVVVVVSFAVTDPCEMPDCDDSGRDYPVLWAIV